MLQIQKVLIPTDFSDAGKAAVEHGARLARSFDAEIHLVHVILMQDVVPLYPMFGASAELQHVYDELGKNAGEQLDQLVENLSLGDSNYALKVLHGSSVAPQLLAYAEAQKVDLVVLGTHGHRGLRHFLLGSVAEEVVRGAKCPVWTCHPELTAHQDPKKLLVPIDLSDHSKVQVGQARALAAHFDASIDFLHVIPEYRVPASYMAGDVAVPFPDIEQLAKDAQAAVERMVTETSDPCVLFTVHVVHGDAGREIAAAAKRLQSDWIIVASHGLTGISHALLGSVAEKVVQRSEVPVLTLHADGRGLVGED